MTTPAHTDFDSTKPSGASTPTVFTTDTVNNLIAARDMIIDGKVKGFIQSRTNGTGSANQPQFLTWYNSALGIGFRWNITWTGFQLTTVTDEWTNDSAASWTAIGAQANTYDGANNITASTVSGGFATLLMEVWTKCLKVVSDFATHAAATGTAVHGLGTAAVANLASMLITGTSTFNGASVGDTSPPTVDSKRVRETFHDYGGPLANGATVTIEWDKYSFAAFTPSATAADTVTIAFSGSPAAGLGQGVTLEIINGLRSADGKITWPANVKWIGKAAARPVDTTLESSGRNIFVVYTRDGGTRYEIQHCGPGG